MLRERFNDYLRPPVFPADEDKTFVAGLLHVILWSLLVGICLYTVIASALAFIRPHMMLIAWLYVLALGALTVILMVVMRRGSVRTAAISVNIGLWIIITVAAYFNGGVIAPAYSGYMIIIICTSLLVTWQWGLAVAVASALTGAVFLLAANSNLLPDWQSTYSYSSVWSANVAYFMVTSMLLALALRAIKRASEQTRQAMAELAHERDLLQALMDSFPDTIYFKDTSLRFTRINWAQAKMLGVAVPEAAIGKTDADFFQNSDLKHLFLAEEQRLITTGEPIIDRVEYNPTPDGQPRWMSASKVPLKDRAGQIIGLVGISRDITDRRRMEETLRESQAMFGSAFEYAAVGMALVAPDHHIVQVNQAFCQMLGYPAVELIGQYFANITYHEDVAISVERHRQLFAGEIESYQFEKRYLRKQGQIVWALLNVSAVRDAASHPQYAIAQIQDITERKQVELALRESEASFRNLADNAPAYIALSDETGLATYLNRAWQEFRDYAPALPIDEWAERIHPDDRRRYLHELQAAGQGQRKLTTEYRLRRADGQYRWLLDTVVPRFTADERFAGFIGIAVDITDRKNAEEALRRSEGRLRLLTDNMVDSISQVDAQQRLVYASPSAERVFGYTLRELLGRLLYDFVHPEDAVRLRHDILLATELRAPSLRIAYRYRHAAGHYLWVESETRLLYDAHGRFAGAVFGSRDISGRKQAEAEREDLIKELADKNAELERFTYTVSHDLKSPLITIRGFLGFLEKDARSGNFDRLHADVTRITEATARMQRLLDELLELSRLGRMNNLPEMVPFDQIAREAVELVQGRIMTRGVRVEIADDVPAVYGDRLRLVEVVQNLVDNAVKFMGDQTEPHIIIGALGAQRSGFPVFFVRDNGLGIEPEYFERIFGLFNKLDAKSEGTGVGLALVKRIIDLHGGQIWVESDGAGHGSTFYFTLPRQAPPPKGD